jgi:hypothetical protein
MPNSECSGNDLHEFLLNDGRLDLSAVDRQLLAVAREEMYRGAYFALCEIVTGEKPDNNPPPEDEFKKKVSRYIQQNKKRLHDEICVKFQWCEKRKRYKNANRLLIYLVTVVAFFADLKSGGMVTASWMIITGQLDELCGCPSS